MLAIEWDLICCSKPNKNQETGVVLHRMTQPCRQGNGRGSWV